jgi:hypothetical protein
MRARGPGNCSGSLLGQDGTALLCDGLVDLDTIGLSRPVPHQPIYTFPSTHPTYKDTKRSPSDPKGASTPKKLDP